MMLNRSHCNKIVFLVVLITIPLIDITAQVEFKEVKLTEKLVLDENFSSSEAYMFNRPFKLRTDSNLNIYVPELDDCIIKVFDKTGQYLRTLGRKGRGPGEFLELTLIHITGRDTIIVIDTRNSRITYFDIDGNLITTKTITHDKISWPRAIVELPNGDFLLQQILHDKPDFLHVFNSDFNNKKYSLNPNINAANNDPIFIKEMFRSIRFQFLVADSNELLFSKMPYDGSIKRFVQISDTQWEEKEPIPGFVHYKNPYIMLGPDNLEPGSATIKAFTPQGNYAVYIYNQSKYLTQLNDGRILHFTEIELEDEMLFGFELYENYVLKAYYIIKKYPVERGKYTNNMFQISWKDKEDNFYFIDNSELPKIIKAKLQFD